MISQGLHGWPCIVSYTDSSKFGEARLVVEKLTVRLSFGRLVITETNSSFHHLSRNV
jgi:hypothetical protein